MKVTGKIQERNFIDSVNTALGVGPILFCPRLPPLLSTVKHQKPTSLPHSSLQHRFLSNVLGVSLSMCNRTTATVLWKHLLCAVYNQNKINRGERQRRQVVAQARLFVDTVCWEEKEKGEAGISLSPTMSLEHCSVGTVRTSWTWTHTERHTYLHLGHIHYATKKTMARK